MQVLFHLGAHSTDGDKLIKSLLKNKGPLAEQGVIVPGPGRYRVLIRETLQRLRGEQPSDDAQVALMDAIVDEDEVGRLVLSNEHFICVQGRVFEDGQLYAQTSKKIAAMSNLFHGADIGFCLGISNPVTFIPALYGRVKDRQFREFLGDMDPLDIRWSDMIARIRAANPAATVTVWCNEDTPLIWGEIMREMAGVEPGLELVGTFDLLREIMRPDGMERFRSYLETHPPQTEIQLRRIIAAFLDKFAIEDAIEIELDIPGWTEEYITSLTEIYEEDLNAIERIPGVTLITP